MRSHSYLNRRMPVALTVAMVIVCGPALAGESGALVLRETASLDVEQRASASALFVVEFEKYGITVTEVEGPDAKAAGAGVTGAKRVFTLDVIAHGNKLVLTLGEYGASKGDLIFGESIAASGMDELGTAVPRVVKAVLLRKKLEETQTVENLTDPESRAGKGNVGEFLWGFGFNFGFTANPTSKLAYGMSVKVMYELEHLRIDFFLGGAGNRTGASSVGLFVTDLSLDYVFLSSSHSPYVGVGVGFGTIGIDADGFDGVKSGPVATVNAGMEFFRRSTVRLLLGMRMVVPFYRIAPVSGVGSGSSSQGARWVPAFLPDVSFVW